MECRMSNPVAGQPLRIQNYAGTVAAPLSTDGFRNQGTLTDPSTATLKVKDPTGTVTSYSLAQLTKDGVGLYHYDVIPAVAGEYLWAWSSTGPVTYQAGSVQVDPAPL